MSLTPREKRFVNEYPSVLCAKTAALRAGYSPATAHSKGSRILQRPAVAAALAGIEAPALARAGITLDRLLEEAGAIAFADIRKALRPDGTMKPLDEIDAATAAALRLEAAVSSDGRSYVKVRSHGKIAAIFLLVRHLMLTEGAPPAEVAESADRGAHEGAGEDVAKDRETGGDPAREALARDAASGDPFAAAMAAARARYA